MAKTIFSKLLKNIHKRDVATTKAGGRVKKTIVPSTTTGGKKKGKK
jgi:hypothetical protein